MNITKGTLRRLYKREPDKVKKNKSFRTWARENAESLITRYDDGERGFSDEVLKLFGVND